MWARQDEKAEVYLLHSSEGAIRSCTGADWANVGNFRTRRHPRDESARRSDASKLDKWPWRFHRHFRLGSQRRDARATIYCEAMSFSQSLSLSKTLRRNSVSPA